MDKDEFIAISARASDDEQIKLRVLWDAVLQNLKSYNKNYSQKKLKNWQSAEKALAEFAAQIESKEKVDAAKAGETLPNILAVAKYLDVLGYKATTSTIYRHRDIGKISPEPNGLFNTNTVDQYAATFLKKKNTPNNLSDSVAAITVDKDISLARKFKAEADTKEFDYAIRKKKYDLTENRDRLLAQRATQLKSDLESFARNTAVEAYSILAGGPTKIPDFIDWRLAQFEKILARYSEPIDFLVSTEKVDKFMKK